MARKKGFMYCVCLVMMLVILTSCGGLSGSFIDNNNNVITFSGSSFTITNSENWRDFPSHEEHGLQVGDSRTVWGFPGEIYEIDWRRAFAGWEYDADGNQINFSATRFTTRATGRFSVTGDQIEFIDSNGSITIRNFSQTQNTVTIGNTRFERR